MRSTSPLPSLTISFRRAETRAFWILTTAVLWVVLRLVAGAIGAPAPWAWGAAAVCVLLPGLAWSRWFEIGIRGWNSAVRLFAAALRAYVLRVSYYLLFGTVSRSGSSLALMLGDADVSRWIARAPSAFDEGRPLAARDGSAYGLLASARRPGRAWMVCLLPIVLLLLLLRDDQQESAPPSSTYTLY